MNKIVCAMQLLNLKQSILVYLTRNFGFLSVVDQNAANKTYHTANWRRAIEKTESLEPDCAKLIEFHGTWPQEEQGAFVKDMRIVSNFISEEEETKLFEEVEPYMKRLRYEYDHWDDAIHGFRETERKHWYPHNREVLDRVRHIAFDGAIMPYIHVLDLSAEGVIKPHVDSLRYCGNTISGISLLSDCVMRLVRTNNESYQQAPLGKESDVKKTMSPTDDAYRSQPKVVLENNFYADILLPRRSLYIMSFTSRYNFTHEILANISSIFRGTAVQKSRRISIICRNEP